jgi:polycystin 2
MITLNTYQSGALEEIEDLKRYKWIDENTRAVIIDFTVYNGNVNLFNQIRLMMEFSPGGGIINSWTVRTSKLLRYVSNFDYFIASCEALFVCFILFYTIEESLDVK